MDPKDLRANAPLSISVNDDSTKYAHSSQTLSASKSKSYHDIESTTMGKVDATAVRPCAIIGPDRVLPQTSGELYLKKTPIEPWSFTEHAYRQPPDYPNKFSDYTPIRNISPRQTFQENMQRIMVPPTYSSIKNSDDSNLKNANSNRPHEAKYCDVPYNINSVSNELKSGRSSDIPMSSANSAFGRSVPHYGWPGGINIRPARPYGAPEIYQYPEYPSCVGPRPVTITRPHRVHRDEAAQVYSERLYQEANIRFKPYPILKEKHQQARYDYINNYQNNFHPPVTFPPHKYDLQKSIQTHPYPMYPQVPLKYLDRRIQETVDGYQRSNQQPNFNPQFHNQNIQPSYAPVTGNCVQGKPFSDLSGKPINASKLPYDNNNKIYLELDTSHNKGYSIPDNVYFNETHHAAHMRGEIILPNRTTLNMHSLPQHQIYRRENIPLKHLEYNPHYRSLDQSLNLNYSLPRIPLQYSPNTIAISPSDSNTSNDTTHTIGTSQEDCGYVSQSSTNSVRSLDTINMSTTKDFYRRHDYNIHAISRNVSHVNGSEKVPKAKTNSLNKKNINVRQFLQMWNEGDDEANESNKDIVPQVQPANICIPSKTIDNQEQLYVLGLVNVPNEELSKYEHVQKISKLPENIKGYNSIELLNQYEELLESSNNNHYKAIPKLHTDQSPLPKRLNDKEINTLPRPVSPLDVEAKISQSVIHKEVGCNFEIKPCSPEMLNAEIATPIQSILGERIIEKVANQITSKSPMLPRNDDSKTYNSDINNTKIASCDMINKQYPVSNYVNINKNNNYNVQDFESNTGISFASLPRLDNDIELNFLEINQQFIKANKIETDTHSIQKESSQLNSDQESIIKTNIQQRSTLSPQFCFNSAPEKEFSKLSKYRKNKKIDIIPKDDSLEKNSATLQTRISSVIMKNPDTKLQEESDISFSPSNRVLCENINSICNTPDSEKLLSLANSKENELPFETAIDFSLNKSEVVTSYDCLDKVIDVPHFVDENHSLSFSSGDITTKNIISNELRLESNLNKIEDHEIIEENVITNKSPIENLITELNENTISDSSCIQIQDLNEKDNTAILKNISNKTEIEEYASEEKNNASILKYKKYITIETSPILESADNEKSKNDVIFTTPNINNTVDTSLGKNSLETTKVESDLKIVECKDLINQNLETDDIVRNDKSETKNDFNEEEEIENKRVLLSVNVKDCSLNTNIVNNVVETTLNDVIQNKIDEKDIVTSVSNKTEKEVVKVLDEIERNDEILNKEENNLKSSPNFDNNEIEFVKEEIEPFHHTQLVSTDELTANNSHDVINETSDNDCQLHLSDNIVTSKITVNKCFNTCEQEIEMIDDQSPTLFKSDDLQTFNNEILENTKDNCNDEKIDTPTETHITKLDDSYNLDANENNVNNFTEVETQDKIFKSIDCSINKGKYTYISKELYSPWIQKLITYKEGICSNIQNSALETTNKNENDDINKDVDEKQNVDIGVTTNVQNNVTDSKNLTNEVLKINDSLKVTGILSNNNKILPTNDLSVTVEDKISHTDENNLTISTTDCTPLVRRNVLKRSLSESALENYNDDNIDIFPSSKRKKRNQNIIHPVISENLCSLIQTNRRNSISTFCNEDNVFILIDNDLIITEENDSDKIYYTEIADDFVNNVPENDSSVEDTSTTVINHLTSVESNLICEGKPIEEEETWVEDVACIETVVTEDVVDDIDYEFNSPKKCILSEENNSQSPIFCDNKHIEKIKDSYGNKMCDNDTQILQTLYMTPQMNVNKALFDIESQISEQCQEFNEVGQLRCENDFLDKFENEILSYNNFVITNEKENINTKVIKRKQNEEATNDYITTEYSQEKQQCIGPSLPYESTKKYFTQSPKKDDCNYSNSSSPEVSSTTPEEKSSSILLKITNHNGSRVSKFNDIGSIERLSYKLTEEKDYQTYNSNFSASRTLITKAAQKYIPPIQETVRDLKIKLTLPQHRLHTLKQLKISKVEPKIDTNVIKYVNKNSKKDIPKKPKPKFEDVLKSIDEMQFKRHKDKVKKGKIVIPKVVIKKNENGAHFASSKTTNDKETYNPDLTGRKWQPWVFLEKNNFIDKMAIKNKVKAVYCHRKNNYVLAEKFRKYKSIYNANFVITQPSSDSSAKGTLKYTIRLKHK